MEDLPAVEYITYLIEFVIKITFMYYSWVVTNQPALLTIGIHT